MVPCAIGVLGEGRGVVDPGLKRPLLIDLAVVQPVHEPGCVLPAHVRWCTSRNIASDMCDLWCCAYRQTSKRCPSKIIPCVGEVNRHVCLDELKVLPNRHFRGRHAILVIYPAYMDTAQTKHARSLLIIRVPIPRIADRGPLVAVVGGDGGGVGGCDEGGGESCCEDMHGVCIGENRGRAGEMRRSTGAGSWRMKKPGWWWVQPGLVLWAGSVLVPPAGGVLLERRFLASLPVRGGAWALRARTSHDSVHDVNEGVPVCRRSGAAVFKPSPLASLLWGLGVA